MSENKKLSTNRKTNRDECDSLERTIEKLKDALLHDSSKQLSLLKINKSIQKLSEKSLKEIDSLRI